MLWKITYGVGEWFCGVGMTVEEAKLRLGIRKDATAWVFANGEWAAFYEQCAPTENMTVTLKDPPNELLPRGT